MDKDEFADAIERANHRSGAQWMHPSGILRPATMALDLRS